MKAIVDPLEAAYRALKDDLLSAAYHLLGERAAAEDVLQDVFCGLARNGRPLDDARDLRQYLVTAVLNRARDRLRRSRREPDGLPDRIAASDAGPAESAAARDDAARVAAALGEIPAEQREVVVMRVYGRLKFREIAQALSLSINTAQSRYRYALGALRERLTRMA
jgi:RNA polymerase sigma-70 factor (ECF subfamily)